MKKVMLFLLIYAVHLLQSITVENMRVFSVTPNILITAIIIIAVYNRPSVSAAAGAFAGLLYDSICGTHFGVYILIYMYLAVAVSWTADEKYGNSPVLMAWTALLYTVAFRIVVAAGLWIIGSAISFTEMCADVFVKGIVSAILAFIVVFCKEYLFSGKKILPKRSENN